MNNISLEIAKAILNQLSIADKIRLIEEILPEIKTALLRKETTERPKLKGLWRSLDISDTEITENRRDIWQNFPREQEVEKMILG